MQGRLDVSGSLASLVLEQLQKKVVAYHQVPASCLYVVSSLALDSLALDAKRVITKYSWPCNLYSDIMKVRCSWAVACRFCVFRSVTPRFNYRLRPARFRPAVDDHQFLKFD